jgi:Holliday junction resolvasome RuvABC endonuclease subunit
MTNLRIGGLDLSITATGIADANGNLSTHGGDAKLGDKRLLVIQTAIAYMADDVDVMMIEDLPRGGMGGATTGMVQGVARCLLVRLGVPYILVPPSTLKVYATSKGNATKADMRMSLYQRFGIDERDDNRADAWWLRALGHDLYRQPLAQTNGSTMLPQSHRRALDKIDSVQPRCWS